MFSSNTSLFDSQELGEMSAHFVTSFDIFLIQAITSLIYCYFGNRITSKSVLISHTAYAMEWYHLRPKIQMMVKLIILRSQREIYFTGCSIIVCSLEMYKKVDFSIIKVIGNFNRFLFFSDY